MWYNKETNELSSVPPWGSSWVADSVKTEHYSDWQEVEGTFKPPAIPMTKRQQYDSINVEYSNKLSGLLMAIQQAQARSASTAVTSLQAKYNALQEEWKTKIKEVANS